MSVWMCMLYVPPAAGRLTLAVSSHQGTQSGPRQERAVWRCCGLGQDGVLSGLLCWVGTGRCRDRVGGKGWPSSLALSHSGPQPSPATCLGKAPSSCFWKQLEAEVSGRPAGSLSGG